MLQCLAIQGRMYNIYSVYPVPYLVATMDFHHSYNPADLCPVIGLKGALRLQQLPIEAIR